MIIVNIEDHASDALRGYLAILHDRTALHATLTQAVKKQISKHIRTVKIPQGNTFGASSTGFWKKAIGSIYGIITADSAVVGISARGVALQYYRSDNCTVPNFAGPSFIEREIVSRLGVPQANGQKGKKEKQEDIAHKVNLA